MIYQNDKNENTQNQFSNALKELQIGKLLRNSNITKSCGVSAYEVFQFLLLLVFQGRNLFRFLNSKHKDQAVSKNTYYRFLNETSYNWSRFLMLLAAKVTSRFDALTRPERIKVLVLDDSVVKRNRSKSVELLARVYDHVEHRFQKEYIEAKYGFKVHTAYIAEVKRDLGLPMYDAPNAVEELKQPRKHPTAEKVEAIKDALKHFEVI